MKRKLKQKKGETLVETLVSLVIIALALMMLPGAVVAAARVNAQVEKQVIFMEKTSLAEKGTSAGTCNVSFTAEGNTHTIENVEVTRFGSEETGLYEVGLKNIGD